MNEIKNKKSFMNSFINGSKNGMNMVINTVIPNVIFSFMLTRMLELSWIIKVLGVVFNPIMGVFGLPGEASIPLVISILSMTSGVTSTAALCESGILQGVHAFIILPFIFLAGSLLTYTGRVLAVTGIKTKYYKLNYVIALLNGVLSLVVMRIITIILNF